jgi:hypothetical protein
MSDIKRQILKFHNRLVDDKHHRYKSWEHCYQHFLHRASSDKERNTAALHLAFYLASWGMYRGSSFLLQKDYLIHRRVISQLFNSRYKSLWNLDFDDEDKDEQNIKLILDLARDLKKTYQNTIKVVDGKSKIVNPTDTLVTKILLGTMGCCPACDRFFIDGYKDKGFQYSRFNKKFLEGIIGFYRKHEADFRDVQRAIKKQSNLQYPVMKLLDMYFWNIGFSLSAKK